MALAIQLQTDGQDCPEADEDVVSTVSGRPGAYGGHFRSPANFLTNPT